MGIPKLGLLLSQNFGCSYLYQINFIFLKVGGQYFITLKKIFQWCITRSNRTSFDLFFQGICGRKSNFQFDSRLFF